MEKLKNEDITCDVIRDILDTHNRIRQSIAEGSINAQPPAANMRELVRRDKYWDSELAAGAQIWANKCTFAHNHPKEREVERFEVGQNIGLIRSRRNNTVKLEFSKHIYNWFDEHKVYQFGPIDNEIIQVAGHYTQLVWANTYLVGCGYSQYKSNNTVFQFFVCHYGPT
ncbi:venom allergen 3-like [Pseudomyrmex gracilis]|uniref:venom allergen 3-like n=1 Tax=Pseudomyrmex gracilis TaxID=219809 RepID=UPI00099521C8|nr:venom allergen 3-like [Pseudomyrmex gracilis]